MNASIRRNGIAEAEHVLDGERNHGRYIGAAPSITWLN